LSDRNFLKNARFVEFCNFFSMDSLWLNSLTVYGFLSLIRPEWPKDRIAESVSPRKSCDNNYLSPERAKESPPQADKKRERLREKRRFLDFKI
jgi:hypothetical protein